MNFSLSLHLVLSVIPSELTLRDHPITIFIGSGLCISFLLIAFAKLIKADVYFTMVTSLTKIKGLGAHTRESYPVNRIASLFLVINNIVATATILLILFSSSTVQAHYSKEISIFIPISLLSGHIGSMYFVRLITGEKSVFVEPIIMKIVGAQFLGLFYFIVSLMWALNPFDQTILINIILWSFLIENSIRLFKSISAVYHQGVSLYYIILYFCTLEILPMIVAYYFIFGDFDLTR